MAITAGPFLLGAVAYLFADDAPDLCPACRFDWNTTPDDASTMIAAAPEACVQVLAGRDGMAPADDGGWNATAYLWHLADLADGWAERWVQLSAAPGSLLVPWDPDALAAARNYRELPTSAGLWALAEGVSAFIEQCRTVGLATPFRHGDWGAGTVSDAVRWVAHEFVHHQVDIAARVRPPPASSRPPEGGAVLA